MRYDVALLKADIRDELSKLQRLGDEFSRIADKLNQTEVSAYDRGAIGYYLHNFYNGCEGIFRAIARFFENDLEPQSWHSDLLKRMTLEIPGYRPALLDQQLFLLLEDFRGFRHKFRYSYGFELDWEKERVVALKLVPALELLQQQMEAFLQTLDALDS